jgi:Tfp pilus assembly protein PilX
MKCMPHPVQVGQKRARSRGVALVVALVFLLMLTLLGISSLNGNVMQERMSYAYGDYMRAFQAADSADTQGEYWLAAQSVKPIPCSTSCNSSSLVWATTGGNATSQFTLTDLNTASWWSSSGLNFGDNYYQDGSSAAARSNAELYRTSSAQYVIEEMGQDPNNSLLIGVPTYKRYYYRISGHGTGASTARALGSTVQSTYVQGYGF